MNQLAIRDISFSYGKKTVFDAFSIVFKSGINVLWGANGSGKTTMFKMLANIVDPQKGTLVLNDMPYDSVNVRKYISFIPQNFNVFPNLKVVDFLRFVAEVKYGLKKTALKHEIERVAELAEIQEYLKQKMKTLSEGMRKRVGIAQAVIGEPILIIADEPTAGLDPEYRQKFNLLLQKIQSDKIILISTHIIEDIRDYYDDITILSHGKSTFQGNYPELMKSLENRVFETKISAGELEAFEQKYRVLLKEQDGDMIRVKAVAENTDDKRECLATPTLSDLWTYYK